MKVGGNVWKFAQDDINTDLIRHMKYAALPAKEQAVHCLEGLDPEFGKKAQPGDIIVGGLNFGCGSSRPAHTAILALGIGAVLAESYSRIFFRNSVSGGLLVVPCPGITAFVNTGDRIEVDTVSGVVKNLTTSATLSVPPLAPFLRDMVEAGGEKAYLKRRVAQAAAGSAG